MDILLLTLVLLFGPHARTPNLWELDYNPSRAKHENHWTTVDCICNQRYCHNGCEECCYFWWPYPASPLQRPATSCVLRRYYSNTYKHSHDLRKPINVIK